MTIKASEVGAKTVKSCPVSRASQGVMVMSPGIVAMIAGAVRDKIEWIVYLNGTRSTDGFEVNVDRITVPKQTRGGAHAELVATDTDGNGSTLATDVVGVMHSHHTMGAFMSGTDKADLNPRFPSSIVVAVANNSLGFSYEAVGKVTLPCGAVAETEFLLSVDGVEYFANEPFRAQHSDIELGRDGLGDCTEFANIEQPIDEYTFERTHRAVCGLEVANTVAKPLAFGQDGAAMLKLIEENTQVRQWQYSTVGKGYASSSNPTYSKDGSVKLSKKQRRKAKFSARRNGLVKLERPGGGGPTAHGNKNWSAAGGCYTYGACKGDMTGCLGTDATMLKKHEEFDEYLCVHCYDEADRVLDSLSDEELEMWSRESDTVLPEDDVKFTIVEDDGPTAADLANMGWGGLM